MEQSFLLGDETNHEVALKMIMSNIRNNEDKEIKKIYPRS